MAGSWNTSPTGRYRVTGATGVPVDDLAQTQLNVAKLRAPLASPELMDFGPPLSP